MKTILLFACVITLVTTTGCFFPDGRGRGGDWHGRRGQNDVAAPIVAVNAPTSTNAPSATPAAAPVGTLGVIAP
jgi:hypothetical protein